MPIREEADATAGLGAEPVTTLVLTKKENTRMIAKRNSSMTLLFSATVLLASVTALAQNSTPGGMSQQPSQQQQQQQQPSAGHLPGAGPAGAATDNQPSPSDQYFVRFVLESDVAEVQLGQLAQQKSQSEDVKQFGQQIAENRTKLDDQFKPIAQQLQVSAPKEPPKKDKQLIAKLEGLSGPQFDEEYIKAVAKDLLQDVKQFKSEAQSAQNPNLQQTAKQDASILAQQLQEIEQIAQSHNVTIDAKH
jgi:putative membrane protein